MKNKLPPEWFVAKATFLVRKKKYWISASNNDSDHLCGYSAGDIVKLTYDLPRHNYEIMAKIYTVPGKCTIEVVDPEHLVPCKTKQEALKLAKRMKKAKYVA